VYVGSCLLMCVCACAMWALHASAQQHYCLHFVGGREKASVCVFVCAGVCGCVRCVLCVCVEVDVYSHARKTYKSPISARMFAQMCMSASSTRGYTDMYVRMHMTVACVYAHSFVVNPLLHTCLHALEHVHMCVRMALYVCIGCIHVRMDVCMHVWMYACRDACIQHDARLKSCVHANTATLLRAMSALPLSTVHVKGRTVNALCCIVCRRCPGSWSRVETEEVTACGMLS